MWQYNYQSQNERAEIERGTVLAESVSAAIQQLSERGLEVTSIERADLLRLSEDSGTAGTSSSELPSELSPLLGPVIERRHTWLPLAESLLLELPSGAAQRATQKSVRRLQANLTVAQFMGDPAAVTMLPLLASHAEPTVAYPALGQWVSQLFEQEVIRKRRSQQWRYPAVLLLLTLIVMLGISLFVVPVFAQMFSEFGMRLPQPTLLTVWVSQQLTAYAPRSLLIGLVVVAVGIPLIRWFRSQTLANRLLGSWVAGTTGNLRAMSRLTGTLAELLSIGLPLAAALRGAAQASGHRTFADSAVCWAKLAEPARKRSLASDTNSAASTRADVMTATAWEMGSRQRLPSSVIHALTAGREGLPSVALLRELALIYRETAQSRQDRFANSLPMFAIMLIGCVVGFVVLSLFMPLVAMITSLA